MMVSDSVLGTPLLDGLTDSLSIVQVVFRWTAMKWSFAELSGKCTLRISSISSVNRVIVGEL